ncbi:MAG: CBS domain-containing protein [Gammaproteobacteria bacterium]|nr:CBS domain-containing protein [Gammaproteobacteria bacterium]
MPIGEICNRDVVFAYRNMAIPEIAQLMRNHHVGDLVVVEEKNGKRIPAGIITDRDIVIELVAKGADVNTVTASDIMSPELVTARESEGVFETIQLMRLKGVRRIPIVDNGGGLAGIVSVDDLFDLLAQEMNELARLISREQIREVKTRK